MVKEQCARCAREGGAMVMLGLGGFGDVEPKGPQRVGTIVQRARGWFRRTAFYRENDEGFYFRMPNGELRRKDLQDWRMDRRAQGLPDTRAAWRAYRRTPWFVRCASNKEQ